MLCFVPAVGAVLQNVAGCEVSSNGFNNLLVSEVIRRLGFAIVTVSRLSPVAVPYVPDAAPPDKPVRREYLIGVRFVDIRAASEQVIVDINFPATRIRQ